MHSWGDLRPIQSSRFERMAHLRFITLLGIACSLPPMTNTTALHFLLPKEVTEFGAPVCPKQFKKPQVVIEPFVFLAEGMNQHKSNGCVQLFSQNQSRGRPMDQLIPDSP